MYLVDSLNFNDWNPKSRPFDMAQLLQEIRRDFCLSQTRRMDTLSSILLGGRSSSLNDYNVLCWFSFTSVFCSNVIVV